MNDTYDIIIVGAGVAGLYAANVLMRGGFYPLVVEKGTIGGGQTLASQGMVHGGQKYALGGARGVHAGAIASMPARWDACFDGWGDIDLSGVAILSDHQIMFPAGGAMSRLAALAAAFAVRGRTRPLTRTESFRRPAFSMQEKVIDVKSLVTALAKKLDGRIVRGIVEELSPDGQIVVSGQRLKAQAIVCAGGGGNEQAFRMLGLAGTRTQRRPLRQVLVRSLPFPFFGHAVTFNPKPRVTVTSHDDGRGGFVWYLGGDIAERGALLSEEETLQRSKAEMKNIFPGINWEQKEWSCFSVDRAEPFDPQGQLPPGPFIERRGQVLLTWPAKLTFSPALSDAVLARVQEMNVTPAHVAPPALESPDIGTYPWEGAVWRKI